MADAAEATGGPDAGDARDAGTAVDPPIALGPRDIHGQRADVRDPGFAAGYLHVYDGLKVNGPNDAPRRVMVLLPREYERTTRRYPVVYMNDGDTAFFAGGAANKSWRVQDALAELYRDPQFPKVIVVAVWPIVREREYTHVFWAPSRDCCGLDEYTRYLADAVKGFVDGAYRTQPAAHTTAIVGSSHGGLAAFFVGTRRPDKFGRVGALSPSFWVGLDLGLSGGPLRDAPIVRDARALLADRSRRPRVWIDWGLVRSGGFHNEVIEAMATNRGREMGDVLTRDFGYVRGEDLQTFEDPTGGHDEDAWARRVPLALRALLR
jgi:pimeloyl-ACP methyl ester carboxylesterase